MLIDRLSNRLGAAAIFHLEEVASHIPERAERRVAALLGNTHAPIVHAPKPPRPAFLLEPAEPITVIAEVPDGPPARFTWRRVTRRVARAEGPERIAPEWWRLIGQMAVERDAASRDDADDRGWALLCAHRNRLGGYAITTASKMSMAAFTGCIVRGFIQALIQAWAEV